MSPGLTPDDRERIMRIRREAAELERYHMFQAAKYAKRARIAFGMAIIFGTLAVASRLYLLIAHF